MGEKRSGSLFVPEDIEIVDNTHYWIRGRVETPGITHRCNYAQFITVDSSTPKSPEDIALAQSSHGAAEHSEG